MDRDTRGLSAPLGAVLLFAIVIAGMVATVTISSVALDQTERELGASRAEKALTQFDSKAAMVALGQTDRQAVPLARTGDADYRVRPNSGWMNVSIRNTTNDEITTVANATLGAVVYENDQATIAYQGGGVWKDTDAGATMVSPPEFHWRNATLTLPIVALDGDESLGRRAQVTRDGGTRKKYPNATLDSSFTNPLENGKVNVTVRSDYYRAWGRYFEQRTDGDVHYDHDRKKVTITLVVPVGPRTVRSSVAATSPGGNLSLSGSGGDVARTDSYTSGDGDGYDGDDHDGGNITAGGTIDVNGNACVVGSLRSGRNVEGNGNGNNCDAAYKVTGDVFYSTSQTLPSDEIGGDEIGIGGITTDSSLDTLIDDEVERIRKDPDSHPDISGGRIDFSGGTVTLTTGEYHLDELVITDGETLDIDTDGGDVTIAVENYVRMTGDSAIDVDGSNKVRVYVKGETETGSGNDLELEKVSGRSPNVSTPNMNASKFWIYGKSDMQGHFKGSSEDVGFQGVVYAPGSAGSTGNVYVEKTQFYGGLVAADVEIDQGGEFHYDRYLSQARTVPKRLSIVRITYLHISVNRIDVTSG